MQWHSPPERTHPQLQLPPNNFTSLVVELLKKYSILTIFTSSPQMPFYTYSTLFPATLSILLLSLIKVPSYIQFIKPAGQLPILTSASQQHCVQQVFLLRTLSSLGFQTSPPRFSSYLNGSSFSLFFAGPSLSYQRLKILSLLKFILTLFPPLNSE